MFTLMTTADNTESDPLRTVKEAAGQLGLSPRKVYNLLHAGKMTYHQFPSDGNTDRANFRIPQSEIDRFLSATRVDAIPA